MRSAMWRESLVVSAQACSTRRVSQPISRLFCGVSRMSEPQAEPAMRAFTPPKRTASQASVPCEVR
jgi:hypothetical protein